VFRSLGKVRPSGPDIGLFAPADSGIHAGQELQIVRSTNELDVFLP
jgi:hypothetical protein